MTHDTTTQARANTLATAFPELARNASAAFSKPQGTSPRMLPWAPGPALPADRVGFGAAVFERLWNARTESKPTCPGLSSVFAGHAGLVLGQRPFSQVRSKHQIRIFTRHAHSKHLLRAGHPGPGADAKAQNPAMPNGTGGSLSALFT